MAAGFVGSLGTQGRFAVNRGYATAATDTGHRSPGIRADWARNHLERQVNYGYLGVHRTAEAAKAIVRSYYGAAARYSYFYGCSNGGRQAMMEAQRYPQDFDGIVAGAPAHDFTGVLAAFAYNIQRIFRIRRMSKIPSSRPRTASCCRRPFSSGATSSTASKTAC